MVKNGNVFEIILKMPRGIHQYFYIVDGETRFDPNVNTVAVKFNEVEIMCN